MLMMVFVIGGIGCDQLVNEYTIDEAVYALVTTFEAVSDSSAQSSIGLRISGSLGNTTAYSLEAIQWERVDTLFRVAVVARHRENSNGQYTPKDIRLDTVMIFQSPKLGWHYFLLHPLNGGTRDSTFVR